MPAFALTATWLKIASAGQAVEIQNLSATPILITAGAAAPTTPDGLLLDTLETRTFALTADLYARVAGVSSATVQVIGGFTLPGITGGGVPFPTALPVITGSAQVGQTLTATLGSWTGAPTSFAAQWARGGASIAGATALTYAPVAADAGLVLTVTITATNAAGPATATSVPTAAVLAAALAGGGTLSVADFTDPANAYLVALAA